MLGSIIGSGIVAIPYSAAIVRSIKANILVQLFTVFIILISTYVYLVVRKNIKLIIKN